MPEFIDAGNDFMSRSTALRLHRAKRTLFDPANEQHLASLKKFLETGGWGDVMFYPEYPYTDVPTYVMTRFAQHQLNAHRETTIEREARLAKTIHLEEEPA